MSFVERIRLRCACFWDLEKKKAGLIDKWQGLLFAQRHGVSVPQVYWHGPDATKIPDNLPPTCVIKGSRGYNSRRVYLIVNGRHQSAEPLTVEQIRSKLEAERVSAAETFMVQEYVTTNGSGRIPLEYQFHMFGSTIGAIQFVDENSQTHRFYDADWQPFGFRVATHRDDSPLRPAPKGFSSLCRHAVTLGSAFGSFVRVDFLQSRAGFVFSEFCATPMGGACYTPEADEFLGRIWTSQLGDLL